MGLTVAMQLRQSEAVKLEFDGIFKMGDTDADDKLANVGSASAYSFKD